MKKAIISILTLSLLSVGANTAFAQKVDRSIRPKAAPAKAINLTNAKTFTLPNGLKVYVVENTKLPRITASVAFDIDPENDGNKAGIKDVFGQLLTAGSKNYTKEKFNEEIDNIGASISASSAGVGGLTLKKHQDKFFQLLSEVMLNPNFSESELEKLKSQMEAGLTASEDEPDAMLANVTKVINYGKNHPYAEITTKESIKNVTLADIQKYYKTYYRPNVAHLALVGDITLEEAKKIATKYFGNWKKADVPKATYPAVPEVKQTTVDFVNRDAAVQSVIAITYPIDLKKGTDDAIRATILNEILGGSSQGRLFLNLREQKAWTYGAYSSMESDMEVGNIQLYAKCRNEVTDSAIVEMLKEMNTLRTEKVTEAQLQAAKNYISGKFALGLESPQTIASFAINSDVYKLPKDYYKNYLAKINAVTAEELLETAKKYLRPENAHIVVVGHKSKLDALKAFAPNGKINFYDNNGNPTAPIEAPKAVETGVSAQTVMNNYINAIGGKAAIESITTLQTVSKGKMMGMDATITVTKTLPNKIKQDIAISTPQGPMNMVMSYNGTKAYVSQMGQTRDLPAEVASGLAEQANFADILAPEQYGITYKLIGKENTMGEEAYTVEETRKDSENKTVHYYSVKTGLLIKSITTVTANGQTQSQTVEYSDYREVKGGKGYKMPYTIFSSGPQGGEIKVTDVKVNPKLHKSFFD